MSNKRRQSANNRRTPPAQAPLLSRLTADDAWYLRTCLPAALLCIVLCFLMRLNWQWFHSHFRTYASDVWYIYINYGWFLRNQQFFVIEYPAAMMSVFKALSLITSALAPASEPQRYGGFLYTYPAWLSVNAVFLGGLSLWATWFVHRLNCDFFHLGRNRTTLAFVLTPTFLYFTIFNYDILPILCSLAALYYFLHEEYDYAFLLAGLGFAFKVYPGFLIPLFWLSLPRDRRRSAAFHALAPWLFCNVPYMLIDFNTWLFPYTWQMGFDSTANTGRLMHHLTALIGKPAALSLFVVASLTLVAVIWRRTPPERTRNPRWLATAALLLTLLFMLVKTVFSPQYIFWILPFLTLATSYPFLGIATLLETTNIGECFFLDYWRGGHELGLALIRFVREIGLIYLVISASYNLLHFVDADGNMSPAHSRKPDQEVPKQNRKAPSYE